MGDEKELVRCPTCNGDGHIVMIGDGWLNPKTQVVHCPTCNGTGKIEKS